MNKSMRLIEAVTVLKAVQVEDDLDKKFTEWQELKRQFAVLDLVAGKIAGRIAEIEGDLKTVIKTCVNQQVNIDDAIVSYKTRNNTSVAYAKVYQKSLEIATAEQKTVLEAYKATVTSSSVTNSLKIVDPKLSEFLEGLKSVKADVLIDKLGEIKKIPDKAPDFVLQAQSESIVSTIKNLWAKVKSIWTQALSKLYGTLTKSQKSIDELMKVSKMKEGLV